MFRLDILSLVCQLAKAITFFGKAFLYQTVINENQTETSASLASYPVFRTDDEWREILTAPEYQVLRLGGTEPAGSGELIDEHRPGVYVCRGCDAELFVADTKFDSHCGWPSFYAPRDPDPIEYIEDRSDGMVRVEVRCRNCGGHLGHIFDDAPQTPTGNRYCINSVSLKFRPEAAVG